MLVKLLEGATLNLSVFSIPGDTCRCINYLTCLDVRFFYVSYNVCQFILKSQKRSTSRCNHNKHIYVVATSLPRSIFTVATLLSTCSRHCSNVEL